MIDAIYFKTGVMPVFYVLSIRQKIFTIYIYMYSKEAGEMVASLPFVVLDRKK